MALGLMDQLAILPVMVPLLVGALLVALGTRHVRLAAALSMVSILGLLACSIALALATADGSVIPYQLGNWPAPFGISLAVDRLSSAMLVVTLLVALACQLAAGDSLVQRGRGFHGLLQFQIAGLCGAFLTTDLFNLFVFFEVLLIASYALLLQGSGRDGVRASVHYIAINLLGSSLFLFAVGLLYGVVGTLNMADLAVRIPQLAPQDVALAHSAGLVLLIVFAIKSALLPLGLWLPGTYAAATAPVAALFAIMTKVGVYSILRVYPLVFGAEAGVLSGIGAPWMLVAALGTIALAACGALAARNLRTLNCWLIAGSAGTLVAVGAVGDAASLGAAVFYLPHTTFAAAAMFLTADLIARARGPALSDRISVAAPMPHAAVLGTSFFIAAAVIAGLPPASGFIAKAVLLTSVATAPSATAIWLFVLAASLAAIIALSRAGSVLFWKPMAVEPDPEAPRPAPPAAGAHGTVAALVLMLGAGIAYVVFAAPLQRYAMQAGAQIATPERYVQAVLTTAPVERKK